MGRQDLPDACRGRRDRIPFGDEYVNQQIAAYREMSGRGVNQDDDELTEFVLDQHDDAANPYAHMPTHVVATHMARIARALERAQLASGSHVLDMGCGWGLSTEVMTFAGLTLTALDINPKFVELVAARVMRNRHGTIAVCGTFDHIPGAEPYDAALFYESLQHAIDRGMRCRTCLTACGPAASSCSPGSH